MSHAFIRCWKISFDVRFFPGSLLTANVYNNRLLGFAFSRGKCCDNLYILWFQWSGKPNIPKHDYVISQATFVASSFSTIWYVEVRGLHRLLAKTNSHCSPQFFRLLYNSLHFGLSVNRRFRRVWLSTSRRNNLAHQWTELTGELALASHKSPVGSQAPRNSGSGIYNLHFGGP